MPTTISDLSQASQHHDRLFEQWDARRGRATLGSILTRPYYGTRHILLRLRTCLLWCAIESELRDILPRIRFRLGPEMRSVEFGPALEQDASGDWIPSTRTYGRITDTQALTSNHPWVGDVEQWSFLEGWEAGARWSENKSHSSQMGSSPPS